jgi:class I lanthipeptide synthase
VSSPESAARARGWSIELAPDRRADALAAARDVAVRVTDRVRIDAAIVAARERTQFPNSVHWEPSGVAQGDAGLALLCAYLDRCFPSEGWDVVGHNFLASAAAHAERAALGPGLFSGLAGLGFVTAELGRDGTRYVRLSSTLDAALLPATAELTRALRGADHGLPVGQFDAISGLSGIGAYLRMRRLRPDVDAALVGLLEALVDLTRASAHGPPRWFTPVELMFDETTAAMYPNGHLNCGLAHGISGPLALMALAHADGMQVRGMRDAIAAIAAWLQGNRVDDAFGVNWPTMVALPGEGQRPDEPSRTAWCYGSPGIARALWLAGWALQDEELRSLATEAMRSVYQRPVHARQIDSPTFCHGMAGLLQITLRFAHDTGDPMFSAAATELTDQMLAAYNPERLLGFCSLEPGGIEIDQPGLLDGAPGVALVLLAAATQVEPTWDRLFLLA